MLNSYYNEFVAGGGATSLRHFFLHDGDDSAPLFDFACVDYYRLIHAYRDAFGADHVYVTTYEQFLKSPGRFASNLAEHLTMDVPAKLEVAPVRKGVSQLTLRLQRQLNRFTGRSARNPAAPLRWERSRRAVQKLDQYVPRAVGAAAGQRQKKWLQELIADRYAVSNAELAKMTGINLKGLGYRCEASNGSADYATEGHR